MDSSLRLLPSNSFQFCVSSSLASSPVRFSKANVSQSTGKKAAFRKQRDRAGSLHVPLVLWQKGAATGLY